MPGRVNINRSATGSDHDRVEFGSKVIGSPTYPSALEDGIHDNIIFDGECNNDDDIVNGSRS